jgi:hypothetical protein
MGDPPFYQRTLSTPHSKEWEAVLKMNIINWSTLVLSSGYSTYLPNTNPSAVNSFAMKNWMVKVTSTSARSALSLANPWSQFPCYL